MFYHLGLKEWCDSMFCFILFCFDYEHLDIKGLMIEILTLASNYVSCTYCSVYFLPRWHQASLLNCLHIFRVEFTGNVCKLNLLVVTFWPFLSNQPQSPISYLPSLSVSENPTQLQGMWQTPLTALEWPVTDLINPFQRQIDGARDVSASQLKLHQQSLNTWPWYCCLLTLQTLGSRLY